MTVFPLDISASSDTWRDEDHTRWANRLGRFTRSSLPVTQSRGLTPPSGERFRAFWFSPEVSSVPEGELAELRFLRVAPARFSFVSVESESFAGALSRDFLRFGRERDFSVSVGSTVVRRHLSDSSVFVAVRFFRARRCM